MARSSCSLRLAHGANLQSPMVAGWEADCIHGAFLSRTPGNNKIEVIPANGGSPMLLVAGDFMPADPNWSPDGKFIVYGGCRFLSEPQEKVPRSGF